MSDNLTTAQMLREFHETYGLPHARVPRLLDPATNELRHGLLSEEVAELSAAVADDDLVEIADALADITYIVYGTALAHGIDLDDVLAEVHRSNMSKLGADGKPIYREDGKVLKGPNFTPPNIAAVLAKQTVNNLNTTQGINE